MSKPVLYSARFCPYAQRVWACLNHFDVDFDLIESLGSGMDAAYTKHPDLLRFNPKGLVPTLVFPTQDRINGKGAEVKCESIDILKGLFLGEPPYADKKTGEKQQELLSRQYNEAKMYNQCICSSFYRILIKKDEEFRKQGWDEMVEGMVNYSDKLYWKTETGNERKISFYSISGEDLAVHNSPTLVDFTVFPWIHRLFSLEHYRGLCLADAVPAEVHEKITSWGAKMEALPSVKKTLPYSKALTEVYNRYADGSAQSQVAETIRRGKEAHTV